MACLKLDAYFDEWEKSRVGVIKNSSIEIIRSRYDNHIKPVLGKTKVQKIEKREVIKLQRDLSKNLSATTTNSVIAVLKSVLNGAVDDEVIAKNPAMTVKPLRTDNRPKYSRQTVRQQYFSGKQRFQGDGT